MLVLTLCRLRRLSSRETPKELICSRPPAQEHHDREDRQEEEEQEEAVEPVPQQACSPSPPSRDCSWRPRPPPGPCQRSRPRAGPRQTWFHRDRELLRHLRPAQPQQGHQQQAQEQLHDDVSLSAGMVKKICARLRAFTQGRMRDDATWRTSF